MERQAARWRAYTRAVAGLIIAGAIAGAAMVLLGGPSASPQPARGRVVDHGTVVVSNPHEILLTDNVSKAPLVISQCDDHGNRVFASRHPEWRQAVRDPSCSPPPSEGGGGS
jgi:hypothetical protein